MALPCRSTVIGPPLPLPLVALALALLALLSATPDGAAAAALTVDSGSGNVTYDVNKSMAWLRGSGCINASITPCPGGRLCTDAEYIARALAAGGVVALDPNEPSGAQYANYSGFNLALSGGLLDFLAFAGFTSSGPWNASSSPPPPRGALGFTVMYPPGAPFISRGGGYCDSHTPIVAHGPHCDMPCAYFVPRTFYFLFQE